MLGSVRNGKGGGLGRRGRERRKGKTLGSGNLAPVSPSPPRRARFLWSQRRAVSPVASVDRNKWRSDVLASPASGLACACQRVCKHADTRLLLVLIRHFPPYSHPSAVSQLLEVVGNGTRRGVQESYIVEKVRVPGKLMS